MKSALREYIRAIISGAIISEAIRSRKDPVVRWEGSLKFNLEKFKSLPNETVMLAYALNFLETLGKGSSRIVFALTSRKVLKLALNPKGVAQNDAELKIYTDPATAGVVTNIHDADEKNRWLIADLVRPIKSTSEFEKLAGVKWQEFVSDLESTIASSARLKGAQELRKDAAPFTKKVYKMAEKGKDRLKLGDLTEVDHWGKTPDGQVVLLDYGFTEEVAVRYYDEPKGRAPTGITDEPTPKMKKKKQPTPSEL